MVSPVWTFLLLETPALFSSRLSSHVLLAGYYPVLTDACILLIVNDVKIHTSENLKDLGSYFLKKRPLNPPCGSKIILISILPNLAPPRLSFRFCDSGAMLILYNGQPPTTLLSQLRGSYCLYVCIIVTRRSQSSTIAPCLGFWIPFRGLWIPGAGFHSFSV